MTQSQDDSVHDDTAALSPLETWPRPYADDHQDIGVGLSDGQVGATITQVTTAGAGFERPRVEPTQLAALTSGLMQGSVLTKSAVSYSFLGPGSDGLWSQDPTATGPLSWSAAEKSQIRLALQQISDVTKLNFVELSDNLTGATLTFEHFFQDSDLIGIGGFPDMSAFGLSGFEGAVGFNTRFLGSEMDLHVGGLGFGVALHEIGHTLGLKHPHDDGGTGAPTFAELGLSVFDQQADTMMSYNDPGFATTGHVGQPGLLDVYVLQELYGARPHNTGDTIYRPDVFQQVIWDTGGSDTIDMSSGKGLAATEGVYIDLREGGVSAGSQTPADAALFGIAFGAVVENAIGTANADTIIGNDVANHLVGGAGNDILDGGAGGDLMEGGAGDDEYRVDNAGDFVVEGASGGYDRVVSTIDYALRAGTEELDLAPGSADLSGSGNRGPNTLIGNDGANLLKGGAGDDTLQGGGGDDTLIGHDGNDVLNGGTGNDILSGREGNDILDGGPGADWMDGGTGDDEYHVDNAGDVVIESAGDGYDRVVSTIDYALRIGTEELDLAPGSGDLDGWGNRDANTLIGNDGANVLKGGAGDDDLQGGGGNDVLIGHDGNDVLNGGTGNDILFGREGNDILDGGPGADRMDGGTGDDEYHVDNAGDVVIESAGDGYDRVVSTIDYALRIGTEELDLAPGSGDLDGWGNRDPNTLVGNDGANVLKGGGGDDNLQGGGGNDRLIGHDGNDALNGGTGNDVLVGSAGNDTLDGGPGDDRLFGDAGNDVFVFDFGSGRDTVADFELANDKIDVRAIGFADFDAVMASAHAVDSGATTDTVFDFSSTDSVTIVGVQPSAFLPDHFLI